MSVADKVENKLRNEMLHLAIQELKPEHRTLLIMFYLEERSYKEICRELRLSEQVMTQRSARARKKLLIIQLSEQRIDEHTARIKTDVHEEAGSIKEIQIGSQYDEEHLTGNWYFDVYGEHCMFGGCHAKGAGQISLSCP
ncbi:RNA polymerase sigma factor [Paenibacillus sp. GCM10027626]|uniref:RNA polymerase sigma factor n=1 Tax=Paenibacillus sp. GCM10027626 TaxID=3273411 RepID=UPI003645D931